jgi:hypothetical protein
VLLLTEPTENIVSVAMGDLDGDGDADILAGYYDGGRVVWYANTGGLMFGPGNQLTDELIIAWHVDVADLNGDGLLDAVASSDDGDRVLGFINGSSIGTGVNDGTSMGLRVSYVPASQELVVNGEGSGPGARLQVQDITGRVIGTTVGHGAAGFRFGTGALARGTYVVVLVDGERSRAARVVVW